MTQIIFVQPDGARSEVDATGCDSVMEAAFSNGIDGVIAECGGNMSCATCHCYIDEAWLDKLPPQSGDEKAMLEFALDVRDNSRLTCQIPVTEDLDGMVVHVPEAQY